MYKRKEDEDVVKREREWRCGCECGSVWFIVFVIVVGAVGGKEGGREGGGSGASCRRILRVSTIAGSCGVCVCVCVCVFFLLYESCHSWGVAIASCHQHIERIL